MSGPIYEPSGKAAEYGELALNIYTGCPHRCYYCFAPNVLHRTKEDFHSNVEPKKNIIGKVRTQLDKDTTLRGKLVHLCFTCDPYPTGYDTSITREIIKLLKEYGNHVQILTKGDGSRDFDLLDGEDWYGITLSGASLNSEPLTLMPGARMSVLMEAQRRGIKTWVSFEPVIDAGNVLWIIETFHGVIDKVKIGKLNYYPSDINWGEFGRKAEALCQNLGLDYYIKESLREEMEKGK